MSDTLESRLRRLERSRRLALGVAGFGLLGLLAAWTSPDTRETVRCHRLELVDGEGRTLGALGTDAEGSTGLFVYDAEGGLRASLTHDADQTALYLYDGEAVIRVGAAQFAHGGGGFALHGPRSEGSAVLYHKDGGSLSFYAADGTRTLQLPDPAPASGAVGGENR